MSSLDQTPRDLFRNSLNPSLRAVSQEQRWRKCEAIQTNMMRRRRSKELEALRTSFTLDCHARFLASLDAARNDPLCWMATDCIGKARSWFLL